MKTRTPPTFDEIDLHIQQVERAYVAAAVEQGTLILPPDYGAQVEERLAAIKSGEQHITVLPTWKNHRGTAFHDVPAFGQIVLLEEQGAYTLYERTTKKRMSERITTLCMDDLSRLCLHFDLLTRWEALDHLPQAEQKGILWRMTELLWEMGQHGALDWMARMHYTIGRAVSAGNALNSQ